MSKTEAAAAEKARAASAQRFSATLAVAERGVKELDDGAPLSIWRNLGTSWNFIVFQCRSRKNRRKSWTLMLSQFLLGNLEIARMQSQWCLGDARRGRARGEGARRRCAQRPRGASVDTTARADGRLDSCYLQSRQRNPIGVQRPYIRSVESQTPGMMGLRHYLVQVRVFDTHVIALPFLHSCYLC